MTRGQGRSSILTPILTRFDIYLKGLNMGILSLIPVIGQVIDKIWPDPSQANEAKLRLMELEQKGELAFLDAVTKVDVAQAAVNLEEGKSEHLFRSCWRPFCGWIGAFALAWVCIISPVTGLILELNNIHIPMPKIEEGILMNVILGMLGISVTRTFEKFKGVN
jgi:hypothetical protein